MARPRSNLGETGSTRAWPWHTRPCMKNVKLRRLDRWGAAATVRSHRSFMPTRNFCSVRQVMQRLLGSQGLMASISSLNHVVMEHTKRLCAVRILATATESLHPGSIAELRAEGADLVGLGILRRGKREQRGCTSEEAIK